MRNSSGRRKAVSLGLGWWSADLRGLTGQAIVTSRVVMLLDNMGARAFLYRGERFRSLGSWLWAVLRLGTALATRRVQVLYLVCSRSTAGFLRDLPAYVVRIFGVRVLVHVHGSDIVNLCLRPGIGPIAKCVLSRCELIVPSEHLLAPLHDLGMRKLHLCENFSEYAAPAAALPNQASPGVRPFKVLWNSNVMASKGFFAVAEAVKSLAGEGRPVCLVALGKPIGDEMMDLRVCQDALSKLVDETWMEYLGPVGRPTAMRLLQDADVVCLPSRYSSECQPLAVIEAMCAARQLVIADTPALSATVGDYPCQKVSGPVASEVACALRRVLEMPSSEAVIQEAAVRAQLRFSANRFDRDMETLLRL